MKKICMASLIFALSCAPTLAAQKTKAQLTTEITNQLPSSGQGAITAAILRQVLQDMVDSDQQILLVNAQTGATYTFLAGDQGKLVTFTNVSVAATLPTGTGSFGTGYNVIAQNSGTGTVTVTPVSGTIDGAASLTINAGTAAWIVSDGLNYQVVKTGGVNAGTAGQLAYYASSTNAISGNPNLNISAGALTIGQAGSVVGQVKLAGNISGVATVTPIATAGTPTITLPSSSGTVAVSASSPLAVDSTTGNATITGLAGGVLAGSGPAFTRTPTLGASGTLGTLAFGNATSGTVTLQPVAGALSSSVLTMPAATDTIALLAASQAFTNKTYNGNTWVAGTGTLSIASSKTITASNSLTLAGTDSTTMTFPSVSATIPRVVASGAKTLGTTAISSAACSSAQTDTATGTLTTDAITASFNGDPTAVAGYVPLTSGMLTIIFYPTADTINFKACNNTSATITPGAVTINWRVIR